METEAWGLGGRGELRPQSAKATASKDPTPPVASLSVSRIGVSLGAGTLWNQKSHQLGLGNTASMSLFCCFFFFPEKSLVLNGKISYYSSVKVRQ